jgi:hypothetical protein
MEEGMTDIKTEQLRAAEASLREGLARTRSKIGELTRELDRGEQELRLVGELLRLRGADACEAAGDSDASVIPLVSARSTDGSRLSQAVVEILRQAGKPLHIQELMTRVRERQLPIPGKGEPANLIAHIRSKSGIVRPNRGMYGLKEWGIEDYSDSKAKTQRAMPRRPRRTAKRTVRSRSAGRAS